MPKIKEIREIPSKIKVIKELSEDSGPEDLEDQIHEAELEDFAEFISGTPPPSGETGEIAPVLSSEDTQLEEPGTRTETTPEAQTEIPEEIRVSYEGERSTYESLAAGGVRVTERNVYNPSIEPSSQAPLGDAQTTPAALENRAIAGQRALGQETGTTADQRVEQEQRRAEYEGGGRGRRGAHEGD